jgi:hypothetical protein
MREPAGTQDANAWFVRTALTREPGQKYTSKEPLPFPVAHRKNADHRFRETQRAVNFEYDFKRRPVDPWLSFVSIPPLQEDDDLRIVQHISFNTIPWRTVEEFNAARDLFDQWRHKHDGQLRTLDDWRRWEQFQAGTDASRHGVRRAKDGVVGQALRIFRRAYAQGVWGLPGGSYGLAAEALTAAGYATKEQDFKNTRRDKRPLPEHVILADAPGIPELVHVLLSIWPEFEWKRLVGRDRITCGKSPDNRSQPGSRMAENLESFTPPYEISFGPVKPCPALPRSAAYPSRLTSFAQEDFLD